MFIDTHAHLSYSEGVNPRDFVNNAIDNNVKYIIVSCCSMDSIKEGLKLIEEFPNIYLTIGIHPEYVDNYADSDLDYIYELAKTNKRIVGIGEIGLDYHYTSDNKESQKELFLKQIDIAKKLGLPVVIHTRDSIQDTYDILKDSNVKGVIHCYSGSYEMAKLFIELGYYLGIGGVITFSNSKLYQVIEKIGLSNIVLETDSPYLAPVPFRGKVNESMYIPLIAERIAEILDVNIDKVKENTSRNASNIFDLDIKL